MPLHFHVRLFDELQDHLIDLKEALAMAENMPHDRCSKTTAVRLDALEHVAMAAAPGYVRGRFATRYPFVLFGLMPLPATLCLFLILGFAFWLLGECLGIMDEAVPRSVHIAFAYTVTWLCRIIPFATVAALFTRAYVYSRVSGWWIVAAVAQVLIVAGLFDCRIHYSEVPGESSLFVGFLPLSGLWPPSLQVLLMHILQMAVPLAIGIAMIRKAGRRRSSLLGC